MKNKQQRAATIFTLIIFIAAIAVLYFFFNTDTKTDTISTNNYYIEALVTPQKKLENNDCVMEIVGTRETELIVRVTNNQSRKISLDDYSRVYKVNIENGNRVKVNEDSFYKAEIIRGYGAWEIVKEIPPYETKDVIFDVSSVGMSAGSSYVIVINGLNLFFTLEAAPTE